MAQRKLEGESSLTPNQFVNGLCDVLLRDKKITLVHLILSEMLDPRVRDCYKILIRYQEPSVALSDNRGSISRCFSRIWSAVFGRDGCSYAPPIAYVRELLRAAEYHNNEVASQSFPTEIIYYYAPVGEAVLTRVTFIGNKPLFYEIGGLSLHDLVAIYSSDRFFPRKLEEFPRHMKPIIYDGRILAAFPAKGIEKKDDDQRM